MQQVFRDTGLCHEHVGWDIISKAVRATQVKAGTAAWSHATRPLLEDRHEDHR